MSELRGLVSVVSFLGVVVILMSTIPTEFLIDHEDYYTVTVPEYFEPMEIYNFVSSWTGTVDNETYSNTWLGTSYFVQDLDDGGGDFGGWELEFWSDYDDDTLFFLHVETWFIFSFRHPLEWLREDQYSLGDYISATELNATYQTYDRLEFVSSCEHFQVFAFFDFNQTTYDDPLDAWEQDELYIFVGMQYDQTDTTYSAWEIIAMLLTFKLPNIQPLINMIIAIPIWISIAYLIFILILRAIGGIFGGGA